MSEPFLRPEVAAALRRWRGVILSGALGIVAVLFLAGPALRGAPLAVALLLLILPVSMILLREGWARARLPARRGPGVVELREGAVAYFGPEAGGAVALDEVTAVSLAPTAEGPVWRIETAERRLEIPAGAEGAGTLLDAFAALPGFDAARMAPALAPGAREPAVLWRREAPGRLRLS